MANKKQKHLIRISRILSSTVIVGLILLLLPLAIPRIMGYYTYNIISPSMKPELPVGSLIIVKPIDPVVLETGDIAVFYSNGIVVSHRVVENNTENKKLITKGDTNADVDLHDTDYANVIGKVVTHFPFIGALGASFSSGSGKLLFSTAITCALLLLIISGRLN